MLFVSHGLLCFALPSLADKSAREAVEALEAYAVYKMAMYDDAFSRFMALAQKGNHQGMLNVAGMFAAGLGTTKDLGAAYDWYRKSANGGHPIGMFYVAEAYQHGHGVEQDHAAARRWYLSASETGSQDAQIAYAKLLLDTGETRQASEWLAKWTAKNSGAAELLAAIENTNKTDAGVAPLDRISIANAWSSIDRSAQASNAHGIVHFLDYDAEVQLRLPGLPTWTTMSKDELRALWERNFKSSGQYRYSRGDLQIKRLDGSRKRYRVVSTINEVLPAGLIAKSAGGEVQVNAATLTITESAIVSIIDDKLRINEIKLDISGHN